MNLNTNSWECCYNCNEYLRADPKGRYRHEIAYDDDYVYIFGGGTQNESFDLETVPAYSFDENKWIYIKTKADPNTQTNGGYPEPRRFHSCIQQDTDDGIEVVIAGGYISQGKYLNDIWKLNLRTHQWQRFAQTQLPYSLFFHDAATTGNGSMYIFGGVTGQTTLRTNDLHKMWTKIPKLSEISWEALIHYRPSLLDKNKPELLEIGVPQKFAERVARGRSVGYIISE